jgi:undecaprenyl-diphosphatase
LLAFFPTALVGVLLDLLHWQPSPPVRTLAYPLLLGGVYLLAFEGVSGRRGHRKLSELGCCDAVLIGIAQTAAFFPGVSRSLMGLTTSLALGFCPMAAVEFTFFLGCGTIVAASGYRLLVGGPALLAALPIGPTAVGIGCAFFCAVPSLLFLIYLNNLLQNQSLLPFGYYRILLGLTILAIGS